MIEKITLDMLNEDSVSVKKQQYIEQDGIGYPIGQPLRRTYENSKIGRQRVLVELPQAQQNAIFAIWGDTPVMDASIEN